MNYSRWTVAQIDRNNILDLKTSLHIPEFTAKLLYNRDITDEYSAKDYIYPHLLSFHTPFLFRDMTKAVERIIEAIQKKEGILVFGDKDADGVTSTAILYKLLQKHGANVAYRVPENMENYGISRDIIAWAVHQGFKLMITVDCGITAVEEAAYAKGLGMDVIITDHHEPHETLPDVYAIINPKVQSDTYPFAFLCGAGTAYKLAQAMTEHEDLPDYYNREIVFFDLETSGLNPEKDDIIEIGAVKVKNGVVIDEFQRLIRYDKPLPPKIVELTNITDRLLKEEGVERLGALREFVDFIGNSKLIGHNIIGFDLPVLRHSLKRYLNLTIDNAAEDTLKISKVTLKKIKDHKLPTVAKYLGCNVNPKILHRAVTDAKLCADVYRRLIVGRSAKIVELQKEFLPLVTIGTIADIMPLTGENRIIVKNGLKLMPYASIGLITLLRKTKLNLETLTAKEISWNISPLLNSPGRMGEASLSVELLISSHFNEAEELADNLIKQNSKRKDIVAEKMESAIRIINENNLDGYNILVIDSKDIPRGITGLLANRLSTRFNLPAVVISSENGDESSGSIRVQGHTNVVNMLSSMSELFNQFGGHKAAGGFTLPTDKIPLFKEKLEAYAKNNHDENDLTEIHADLSLSSFEELSLSNLRYLQSILEPIGNGNPPAIFLFKKVRFLSQRWIGKTQNHLLATMESDGTRISLIAWNAKIYENLLARHQEFDLMASPEINRYQGNEEPRLLLLDLCPSGHSPNEHRPNG